MRGPDVERAALDFAEKDVLLGEVEGCPFYVGAAQYGYWAPYQIIVDVTEGGGDSFSIEAADGVRFTVLSRPLVGEEVAEPPKTIGSVAPR